MLWYDVIGCIELCVVLVWVGGCDGGGVDGWLVGEGEVGDDCDDD